MNFENFVRPKAVHSTKKSSNIAVISKSPKFTPEIPDLSEHIRRQTALQREYNAALHELLELRTQLLALDALKRRAAAKTNPGLFRVPDAG